MSCNCRFRNELRRTDVGYVPNPAVYPDCNTTTPPGPAVLGAFDRASASLRISLGRWSRRQDFFRLAEALESVYKSER